MGSTGRASVALVLGTGTSGHDVAQDLCVSGAAEVTLIQHRRSHQLITAMNREADRELLQGLERRGFRLIFGPDDTGWQIMYQSRGGGYYFDAGCSQMIVDGRVGLIQYADIKRFGPDGATMKDGKIGRASCRERV